MSAAKGKEPCLFAPCNGKGALTLFKSKAVANIVATSNEKGDDKYSLLSSDVMAHKSCYCTYTSKTRHVQSGKRKAAAEEDGGSKKQLKSQATYFDFKRDCLFCGNVCVPKDSKNPQRWVPVKRCRTVDRGVGVLTFKEQLENICEERADGWSRDVSLRLSGVRGDLHASDAQYHVHCHNKFRKVVTKSHQPSKPEENALRSVIDSMNENKTSTWTTSDLYNLYLSASGTLSKKQMIANVTRYFGEDVLVMHVEGCESILGMRASIGRMVKLVKSMDDDNDGAELDKLVRQIKTEALATPRSGDYHLRSFEYTKIIESTSPTLLTLISSLVSAGCVTKKAVTLAQCVEQHIGGNTNQTTLGLAVKLHHKYGSRELIQTLNEHGITASYDEVLRFRKSAAKFVTDNQQEYHKKLGLTTEIGPIFSWADNYDLFIASPNGTKTTHAMVCEFTQHPAGVIESSSNIGVMQLKIPRLKKHELSSLRLTQKELQLAHYTGPSKLNPPLLPANDLSTEEAAQVDAARTKARARDAAWLSHVHTDDKPVEWAGFNARLDRQEAGAITKKPKTLVVFGPLLDAPPAHPDTVLTTLIYLEKTLKTFGMQYAHLSVDLQLYQTACLVQWSDPDRWKALVLHPGMMHTLMSFLGCIGTLMKASGLDVLLTAAFGGVTGITTGKSWTNALRAYRLVTTVLLQGFFQSGVKTYQELNEYLEIARQHPTGRLWVDCMIKPTLLALQLLRAEREGDFLLQQISLKAMMPYYFAAGHRNYARYMTWYLRQAENLPKAAKNDLLNGAHVCRHSDGGTAVPADQFGEQTYIKRGKGAGGLKGISTNAEQVAVWVSSFSICAHLDQAVEEMYYPAEEEEKKPMGGDDGDRQKESKHKEEGERRRKIDAADRTKIAEELQKHSHPLTVESTDLYNIVNGQIAPTEVNVQDALKIGSTQSEQFAASLFDAFHGRIERKVKTMQEMTKVVVVNDKAFFDIETLFARLLVVGQQRDVKVTDIFKYELSPVPPSLMDEFGRLRKGDKAVLVKCLGVPVNSASAPDVVLVDASQLLYHVVWPVAGTAGDLVASFGARLSRYPPTAQKLVLFDRYYQNQPTAKDHERLRRAGSGSKDFRLTHTTPLPHREAILKNSNNKRLLSSILCGYPLQNNVQLVNRLDSLVTHEEADITLCSYMLKAAASRAETIRVLCDDTDVFVLLVYWAWRKRIQKNIQMEKWDGTVLDIRATVDKLGDKCGQLLGMHALSGCDTVSYPCGKGKKSALKVLTNSDIPGLQDILGEPDVSHDQIKATADSFFLALYGQKKAKSLNAARSNLYLKRKKPPPLKKLPPTDCSLRLHALRAHLQMMLWKAADQKDPPAEAHDIRCFGWDVGEAGAVTPSLSMAPVAPQELLDVVSCRCSAEGKACSDKKCSCHNGRLPCTEYCYCEGGDACCNLYTKHEPEEEEEEEDEGDEEFNEDDQ